MGHWLDKVLLLLSAPTADLRELARLVDEDPRTFYRGIDAADLEVDDQDVADIEFGQIDSSFSYAANDNYAPGSPRALETQNVIKMVRSIGRQEERVALTLDLMLKDRALGFALLQESENRGSKFENYAIEQIQASLPSHIASINDQAAVASLVSKFFTYTFPMNRGRLLFFLARHLSKYPVVNKAIKRSLDRTASMFVEEYRTKINDLLRANQ